jgi:hypothetical protein
MGWPKEMRKIAKQKLTLAEDVAGQADVAGFESAEAAVEAERAAAGAGGEIVLLNQQGALAGAGTFAGDGDAD